jgi:hypothetical protein
MIFQTDWFLFEIIMRSLIKFQKVYSLPILLFLFSEGGRMFDNSISNNELLEETVDPWAGTVPGQQGAQHVSRHTWMEQCRASKEPYEQRGAGDTASL